MNYNYDSSNVENEIRNILNENYVSNLAENSNPRLNDENSPANFAESTAAAVKSELDRNVKSIKNVYYFKSDVTNTNNDYMKSIYEIYNAKQEKLKKIRNLGSNRLRPIGIKQTLDEFKKSKLQKAHSGPNVYIGSSNLSQETSVAADNIEIGIINLRGRQMSISTFTTLTENQSVDHVQQEENFDVGNDNLEFSSSDDYA
ncbi:unnamed protein product [Hanseniaspora opuntiae]